MYEWSLHEASPSRDRIVADLRAAAALPAYGETTAGFARIFTAAADAVATTPISARWGNPKDRADDELDEELRWSPLIALLHALAVRHVAVTTLAPTGQDPAVDLDAVASR